MAVTQSNAGLPAAPLPAVPLPAGAPRAGVIHVRHRHTDRFTVVGNHLAQHPLLSAVAIGLAVYILSLPDGAPVTVKALAARFPEGETRVRRAMNELEAAGYLERRRVPLGGGRFATRAFAYDRPGRPDTAPGPGSGPGRGPGRAARPGTGPGSGFRPGLGSGRGSGPGPGSGAGRGGYRRSRALVGPGGGAPASAVRIGPAEPVPVAPRPAPSGPAADLLARLRLADCRLLLAARDIARLAPAVDEWLGRAVSPAQITRTLTAGLPPDPVPIHHPARFLEHRLTVLIPPPLPATDPVARPAPLRTCDGCDRAFRTHDPAARCADCHAGQ